MTGSRTASSPEGPLAPFLALRSSVVRRPIGDGGWGTCHALSDALDAAIAGLVDGAEDGGFAIVAVGGYGRREQCIHSDIDLMILHDAADTEALARAVFYPLWDAGLKVGHSVRTVKECIASGREDFPTLTSLLSSRLVAGDPDLVAHLNDQLGSALAGRPLAQRLAAFERERILAEPYPEMAADLKEGRGGLRTYQALWWLRRRAELVGRGDAPVETTEERRSRTALLRARNALHAVAGKPHDRFVPDLRGPAASWLGDEVIDLARSVTTALRTGDRLAHLHLPDVHAESTRRWFSFRRSGRSGSRATRPLQAAAAIASRPSGQAEAGELEVMASPTSGWTDDDRSDFLAVLSAGARGRAAFDALLQAGWIEREFPEYLPVVAGPQLAPFHEHPADIHLWKAVDEAIKARDEDAWLGRIAGELAEPNELLLAAFLHDIGKCRPGDHSVVGAELASDFLGRAGFPAGTVDRVSRAVREHLLLADTATRRDLSDPKTVVDVVDRIGDADTLRLVYLVSIADARATGPVVWSPWKASLLRSLFIRVAVELEPDGDAAGRSVVEEVASATGRPVDEVRDRLRSMGEGYAVSHEPDEIAAHLTVMEQLGTRTMALAAEGKVVTIVAPDRTGLLGDVAGVLAIHNISIHEAKLWTRPDGIAIDTFAVSDLRTDDPVDPARWDVILGDLEAAADGDLDLDALVAAKRRDYRRTIVPMTVEVGSPADPSQRYTAIEVRCADQPGALFTIVGALYRAGLDIQVARIETWGTEVRDTFFVRDSGGAPIRDVGALTRLVASIRADLRTRL